MVASKPGRNCRVPIKAASPRSSSRSLVPTDRKKKKPARMIAPINSARSQLSCA